MTTFLTLYFLVGIALGSVATKDQNTKLDKFLTFICMTLFWLPVLIFTIIWPPDLSNKEVDNTEVSEETESVEVVQKTFEE